MKHTPGPWTADVDSGEITAEVGAHIGMIDGEDDFERELSAEEKAECVANMRLVAAAPELLAACKNLLAHFTPEHLSAVAGEPTVGEMLKAAIAKAEGAQ